MAGLLRSRAPRLLVVPAVLVAGMVLPSLPLALGDPAGTSTTPAVSDTTAIITTANGLNLISEQLPSLTPTLTLTATPSGKPVLLSKGRVPVVVSCGAAACELTVRTKVTATGKAPVKLRARTVTLAAGASKTLRLKTTKTQAKKLKSLVKGTGPTATFALTATTTSNPSVSADRTVPLSLAGASTT